MTIDRDGSAHGSAGWSGGNPDDFAAMTLVRVSTALARRFLAVLAPYELHPSHFSVLLNLVENPGCSQADLARTVLATPQSVGELLRVMEDHGTVERHAPAGRGRPSAVYASARGRALLDEVTPHVLAAFDHDELGLSREALGRLNTELHVILSALSG